MASSEVSEVFPSFDESLSPPDGGGGSGANDDELIEIESGSLGGLDDPSRLIYGEELIAVSSEDVPQSEEIIGAGSRPDDLHDTYDSIPVSVPSAASSFNFSNHRSSGIDLEHFLERKQRMINGQCSGSNGGGGGGGGGGGNGSQPLAINNGGISVVSSSSSPPPSSRPPRGRRKPDSPFHDDNMDSHTIKQRGSHGSWQQKRVSIKTLEGEFSVTMWASGTDDGNSRLTFLKRLPFPGKMIGLL